MKYLARLAVVFAVVVVATVGLAPQQRAVEAQTTSITCGGVLFVSAEVNNNLANPVYRVNGNGPNLPSAGVSVPTSITTSIEFVIQGPGTWSDLYLEYSDGGAGPWTTSIFSLSASCGAAGCDQLVPIPSTAVVGTITDNAAVFGLPDPGAMTNTVLEVGKTFWMDGVDSTGMYRKVLISCTWTWVEASKTGPNYDDVWNGTPLPGHTVS